MGLIHHVLGATGGPYGNPTYFPTKEGFTTDNLAALYLFDADDGALDANLITFQDKSGNGHHGTLVTGYGGIVRKAYGAQVNNHAYGLRIASGVPVSSKGHLFLAVRSAQGGADLQFPMFLAHSNQSEPLNGPLYAWNSGNAALHKKIGMLDKDNVTLPAPQYIDLANGDASIWQAVEYAWDGVAGTQQTRNLLAGVGPTADADFTTLINAAITAGYTLQPGVMRYSSGLDNVKAECGVIALYTAALGPEERDRNLQNVARIMYSRGTSYAPQGYLQ
jgi:hypothetical protein